MAIVVKDKHGAVLASCNSPNDIMDTIVGDGVSACRWRTDSSTNERILEASGIGMREQRMLLFVEAMLGGVTVAQSQPLDVAVTAGSTMAKMVSLSAYSWQLLLRVL